jgi:MYXO-CTERM domain-containing protein
VHGGPGDTASSPADDSAASTQDTGVPGATDDDLDAGSAAKRQVVSGCATTPAGPRAVAPLAAAILAVAALRGRRRR